MKSDLMIVSLVFQAKDCLYFSSLPEGKQTLVSYEGQQLEEHASAYLNENYTMSLS